MDRIAPLPIEPASNAVDYDTPCRRCGYNLRGLPVGGQCPECAAPVGLSLFGNLLRFSDPAYVRTLGRGFTLIVGAPCAVAGMAIVLGVMLDIVSCIGLPTPVVAAVIGLVVYGAIAIGFWLVTRPDPAAIRAESRPVARWLARAMLIVGLAACVYALRGMVARSSPGAAWITFAHGKLALLAIAVSLVVQLHYVSRLAGRIPDKSLGRHCRCLMYALSIFVGVCLLGSMSERLPHKVAGVPLIAIALLPSFVFVVLYLVLLDRTRQAMIAQAELAQKLGPAASGPHRQHDSSSADPKV